MFKPKYYKSAWDVAVVLLAMLVMAVTVLWAERIAGDEPDEPKVELIVSPWEGVFHSCEYEGAQPFVEVGSHVLPGTMVGFVNVDIMQPQRRIEIYAGVEGTVIEVLVQDGELVSAGQPLMAIRLDAEDSGLVRP